MEYNLPGKHPIQEGKMGIGARLRPAVLPLIFTLSFQPACGSTDHDPDDRPMDQPAIQERIDAAGDGDTILVAPGTYLEHIDFLGKSIILRSEGGPDVTVIDGNQAGSVVTIANSEEGECKEAVIDGFTIRNGKGTPDYKWGYYYGGGIYCSHALIEIRNCTITGNTAIGVQGGVGGGIYCYESSPTIASCTVSENSANSCGGICLSLSLTKIKNCSISGNSAVGLFGGEGGGIGCGESPLTIINSVISGNYAALGGGMACTWHSPTTITNCMITENSAYASGGGICSYIASPLVIMHSTISGNRIIGDVGTGGGIFCMDHWDREEPIRYPYDPCLTIDNSILWGNCAHEGPQILAWCTTYVSYSDIQWGWSGGWEIMNADPLFVGGGDYHLRPGSPCIDAGGYTAVFTDVDGQLRPFGDGFDLGADEYWPGFCEARIVPISHAPISFYLIPVLLLIFIGRNIRKSR